MPFGILECHAMEHVPGTAVMHEQSDIPDEYREVPVELLKKGQGRFSHIVLVPQPTDDPNDPLNVGSCAAFNSPSLTVHSGHNGRKR